VSNDIYHYGVIVMIYCEKREFVKRSDVSDVNRIQISTLSYRNLNLNLGSLSVEVWCLGKGLYSLVSSSLLLLPSVYSTSSHNDKVTVS